MTESSKDENLIDRPYGDKDAMKEILEWSKKQSSWLQDALRRIIQNGELESTDIKDLVDICVDNNASFKPLDDNHISTGAAQAQKISLGGVKNPKQINALAAEQSISFKDEGLTIVYGDNGSGKSGFVRILKHACRSRDKNINILRDIENLSDQPQSASIKFFKGGTEEEYLWKPEENPHPDLPLVSIFDSRSASTHVEKTNELAYSPFSMQVLETLRAACDSVQSEIDNRIKELKKQTPGIISNNNLDDKTVAGEFLATLSENSLESALDKLTLISQEEEKNLTSLTADLADDPARVAARLNAVSTRFSEAIDQLKGLIAATSDGVIADINGLRLDFTQKASLAKTTSEELFASSPLPDIGSELWRTLWEAARRYSDLSAYTEKEFPAATEGQDLCVLCQQPLDAEAVERRLTFEGFIKGETKTAEDTAELILKQKLDNIKNHSLKHEFVSKIVGICQDELENPSLSHSLRKCVTMARWRYRAILHQNKGVGSVIELPQTEIDRVLEGLATRISELTSSNASPERIAMIARLNELKDRKALATMKSDVKAEIARLKKISSLKSASSSVAKLAVTNLNKKLSNKLVTDALRDRFAREIQKLEVSAMPMELQKSDLKAVSLFRVCFVERPDEPVGEVLSEGEHRCVALAAFLAELVTSRNYSGIVFDDPMSSLDHLHRKAVAKRLVEEAGHRQVVIFTHDLPFMFELKRESEAQDQEVHYQHVHRHKNKPGYVKADMPLKAKPGLELANALKSELKAVKHKFDDYSETNRTVLAKGYIEKFREAWDQGIADFIMPVLGRFDNKIAGGSLYKLEVLTDTDVETVTAARRRLSEDLHFHSEALNPSEVSHSDLVAEVTKLESWMSNIKLRQKNAIAPVTSYT